MATDAKLLHSLRGGSPLLVDDLPDRIALGGLIAAPLVRVLIRTSRANGPVANQSLE